MGKGKGSPEFWVARVKPGRIMFEIDGVPWELAKEALSLASAKLPLDTKIVRRLGDALGSRAAPSRILWLTVTAVATPSLPSWKRARMSAARSRAFNDLAAPVLRAHGIEVVDTFASGLRHPELSPDGVHFPGTLSQYHAHLLLEQLCSG